MTPKEQVAGIAEAMTKYAASRPTGRAVLPGLLVYLLKGYRDESTIPLSKDLCDAPMEAFMAAFARVYDGSMAEVVNLIERELGLKITTASWFAITDPVVTQKRTNAQTGVHIEEVSEMFDVMSSDNRHLNEKMAQANALLKEIAGELKSGRANLVITNLPAFHDSLDDQRVTGQGVGALTGMDCAEVAARVDWSNHTKFVDRKPLYKEGGKVAKGPYWEEAKPL